MVIISNLPQSGQTKNLGCDKMKIKCVKSICELDQKPGLMQVFYGKDGALKSAGIRHYLGTVSGKSKFSYCSQSLSYAETETKKLSQKPLIESVPSKAIAIGESQSPDLNGQVNGLIESGSNSKNKSNSMRGLSLAWLGHQLPKLTTRVQIPETAPFAIVGLSWTEQFLQKMAKFFKERIYTREIVARMKCALLMHRFIF